MTDSNFLLGTLDVLILKTLSWGPMHGYGVGAWMEETAGEIFHLKEGSLYPALYRMERKGWIDSEWRISEKNRKARYYRLTPAGWQRLHAESTEWARFATAVGKVLNATDAPSWAG